jgi:hypothetical protein
MNATTPKPKVTMPAPLSVWRRLLQADPSAVVSQSPEWVRALCDQAGYEDATRLYELSNGRQLVLPMVRRRGSNGRMAVQASHPYGWGTGGILAEGGARPGEVAAVFSELARQPALLTVIRPNPLLTAQWSAARPPQALAVRRLAHVLDLKGGFETVWQAKFNANARRSVRRAERSGLTVERDDSGRLVPVFYELYERSVERWAAQQHEPLWLAAWRARRRDPINKFRLLAESLGETFRVWVAWHNGAPAASIVVLQGVNASYIRGAMDKDLAARTRANYLLHRLAIEDACAAGCHYYHMGESGESSSLAEFKMKFGALPHRHAEYRLERLPLTKLDRLARGAVKRAIRFKDVPDQERPVAQRVPARA